MNRKNSSNPDKYKVPAVDQACRVLFCLAGNSAGQMSLTDICARVGIHKSKAYSILLTLQANGLVRNNADRKGYALGPALIALSRKVLDDLNPLQLAEPILERLALKLKCTATFGLIAGDKVFVAAQHEGSEDIGVSIRTGHRFPLTYGSHGKAIAAFLPAEAREQLLLSTPLYFHGAAANFDPERLRLELEECRRNGFALDLGEMTPGINSVAVPVFGAEGVPIGYLAMVGLFSTADARTFGPELVVAGENLSQQLGAETVR
jgi:DNA-binding IclR family transcriptional regulator